MANQHHLDILKQGVASWNSWKRIHSDIEVDLSRINLKGFNLGGVDFSGANLSDTDLRNANLREANLIKAHLSGADLSRAFLRQAWLIGANPVETGLSSIVNLSGAYLTGANLSRANLNGANLSGAYLTGAQLRWINLSGADLSNSHLAAAQCFAANLKRANLINADLIGANLERADLSNANLSEALSRRANFSEANLSEALLYHIDFTEANLSGVNFWRANLNGANLNRANLNGANLSEANISEANLTEAILTGCSIYAISAWNVFVKKTTQSGLIITRHEEPIITVDNLEVAQFIYLLLNNQKIRDVIDSITSKVVLILGRFSPERKKVLDAISDELRKQNYLPVMFDFEKPSTQDFTETIITLAHLSRFIIADLTDPGSIPHELQAIVPQLAIPVQPLMETSKQEYSMFPNFNKYPWVLPIYRYRDNTFLIEGLKENVIDPAEKKIQELEKD